jgi:hypothetical protein
MLLSINESLACLKCLSVESSDRDICKPDFTRSCSPSCATHKNEAICTHPPMDRPLSQTTRCTLVLWEPCSAELIREHPVSQLPPTAGSVCGAAGPLLHAIPRIKRPTGTVTLG